jgi:hypothetical protein
VKRKPAVAHFWHERRIEMIMWCLIGEMLASPAADTHPHFGAVLGIVVLATVLAGVSYVGKTNVTRFAVLPAAGLWLVARSLEAFGDRRDLYTQLSPVAGLLLSCSVLWAIFDHFSSVPEVPRSAIAEAFIGYLVIATAFSQLYWILNRILEQPFNQPISSYQTGTFLYFSMMTISGVGYGGILPVNPYLRIIAALETMTGIFFVAVVVARLVSAYRPQPRAKGSSTSE